MSEPKFQTNHRCDGLYHCPNPTSTPIHSIPLTLHPNPPHPAPPNLRSDLEKCIFLDKFLTFPKNFGKIATFLTNKNAKDCVRFYYDSKQTVNYKVSCARHCATRPTNPPPKHGPTNTAPTHLTTPPSTQLRPC